MCTVSWRMATDGCEVFFNRDERRERKPALPPTEGAQNGIRFLAPRDGDHGGSWIFVNAFGLIACLLNHYPKERAEAAGPFESRGLLLLSLTDASSASALGERLRSRDLSNRQAFLLLAFGPRERPTQWVWDGQSLSASSLASSDRPVTTSSHRPERVIAARKRLFENIDEAGEPSAKTLMRLHCQHDPKQPASSVCMSRTDACTVSLTRARALSGAVEMEHAPRKADGAGFEPSCRIALML